MNLGKSALNPAWYIIEGTLYQKLSSFDESFGVHHPNSSIWDTINYYRFLLHINIEEANAKK